MVRVKVPFFVKLVLKHGLPYVKALVFYGLVVKILNYLTLPQLKRLYGDFHLGDDFDLYPVEGFNNYTGVIVGTLNYFIRKIPKIEKKRVLLAGEEGGVKNRFGEVYGFGEVVTTGIGKKEDYYWNFEESPSKKMGDYDVVVSQAVLEHLIDPYKHVVDLVGLTKSGGYLLFQTIMPGSGYHRAPVDCLRFYPDWFEEVAERLNLKVIDKGIWRSQICYMYQKN
jgi:hypothetical protein